MTNEHKNQTDHTALLRILARRARCFPTFPLGYHIPEVFAAIGEKPPALDPTCKESLKVAPAVPQGWKLVPVEPTPEMKAAGINIEVYSEVSDSIGALTWAEVDAIYRAMLAATPAAPSQEPAVPQGWTDADSDAARLALELECLLLDTETLSVVSKWWASANEALELHRRRLATLAAASSRPVTLTDEAVNAAAKVLAERFDYPWEHMPEEGRKNMRVQARAVVIAALREKERERERERV